MVLIVTYQLDIFTQNYHKKKNTIIIDRKIMADLAEHNPETFENIVK